MRHVTFLLLAIAMLHVLTPEAMAVSPTETELAQARAWAATHLSKETASTGMFPFSFIYDGQPSQAVLPKWVFSFEQHASDGLHTQRTLCFTEADTKVRLRCEISILHAFPVVEWTLYLSNQGNADSPVIENIRSLDLSLEGDGSGFLLRGNHGDHYGPGSYAPWETGLKPDSPVHYEAKGGRPTNGVWPYYNITFANKGLIAVLGWPGQWEMDFSVDESSALRLRGGQQDTRFILHPGEEVRSPSSTLLFYEGNDHYRAQNLWRRYMMAHIMPRPGGALPEPGVMAASSCIYREMVDATEANQRMCISRYLEEDIKLDWWWMDAGWYPVEKEWYDSRGNWVVDRSRFPDGLKPVSEFAASKDVKTILWFEPESVSPGTWPVLNKPQWLLGDPARQQQLLDLGNPEAWAWVLDRIDKVLTRDKIDLYRQDFNQDPLVAWRAKDAPDRRGITEAKHIMGYLALWDTIQQRHPDILIDSCASGGRRNDLESMKRGVPLLRSDHRFHSLGNQCHSYGLSLWLPAHGTCTLLRDTSFQLTSDQTAKPIVPYSFWSDASVWPTLALDVRVPGLDYPTVARLIRQWRSISDCYYGDFWPLTEYSLSEKQWMAWQYDVPEKGFGMVQAFRRKQCEGMTAVRFRLRGLDPEATYRVTRIEEDATSAQLIGKDLLERGLLIEIGQQPGAAVVRYEIARK